MRRSLTGQHRPVDGAFKIAPKPSLNDVGREKRRLREPSPAMDGNRFTLSVTGNDLALSVHNCSWQMAMSSGSRAKDAAKSERRRTVP
jgi:hypothetical protein